MLCARRASLQKMHRMPAKRSVDNSAPQMHHLPSRSSPFMLYHRALRLVFVFVAYSSTLLPHACTRVGSTLPSLLFFQHSLLVPCFAFHGMWVFLWLSHSRAPFADSPPIARWFFIVIFAYADGTDGASRRHLERRRHLDHGAIAFSALCATRPPHDGENGWNDAQCGD